MPWKFHRFCLRMPSMTKDAYAATKSGMKAYGYQQNHPVMMFRGEVVDGRHRLLIAEELKAEGVNVDVCFDEWKPPASCKTEEEIQSALESYTLIENALRRNISETQLAQILVRDRGLASKPDSEVSLSQMSRETGIDRATLSRARSIQRASPEIAEDVAAGKMGTEVAMRIVKPPKKAVTESQRETLDVDPEDDMTLRPTQGGVEMEFKRWSGKLGELVTLLSRTKVLAMGVDKRLGGGTIFIRTLAAAHEDCERWSRQLKEWATKSGAK